MFKRIYDDSCVLRRNGESTKRQKLSECVLGVEFMYTDTCHIDDWTTVYVNCSLNDGTKIPQIVVEANFEEGQISMTFLNADGSK